MTRPLNCCSIPEACILAITIHSLRFVALMQSLRCNVATRRKQDSVAVDKYRLSTLDTMQKIGGVWEWVLGRDIITDYTLTTIHWLQCRNEKATCVDNKQCKCFSRCRVIKYNVRRLSCRRSFQPITCRVRSFLGGRNIAFLVIAVTRLL